ncbi:MAG TPA: TetR-like C-terminal domain-containing protein [Beutenbergiaceae bacterium]|nr:TetR-like C-terminal domain-containing protein [Beutenbergiaceae bacterium]
MEPPDTHCTLCDLHESLSLFSRAFARVGAATLAHLLADSAHDEDFRGELIAALVEPQREAVGRTLVNARARGDLRSDLDLSLTVDALSSLVFYRQLFGPEPLDDAEIGRAVSALLGGIATDYDALLRASLEHDVDHAVPERAHPE